MGAGVLGCVWTCLDMFEGGRGWARVFWVVFGHVWTCLRVGAGGRGCSGLCLDMFEDV